MLTLLFWKYSRPWEYEGQSQVPNMPHPFGGSHDAQQRPEGRRPLLLASAPWVSGRSGEGRGGPSRGHAPPFRAGPLSPQDSRIRACDVQICGDTLCGRQERGGRRGREEEGGWPGDPLPQCSLRALTERPMGQMYLPPGGLGTQPRGRCHHVPEGRGPTGAPSWSPRAASPSPSVPGLLALAPWCVGAPSLSQPSSLPRSSRG